MENVAVTILIKNNKFMGILGPKTSYPNSIWWDREMKVEVPKTDWDMEKVTVNTIGKYLL
jgi:hypothetical protein